MNACLRAGSALACMLLLGLPAFPARAGPADAARMSAQLAGLQLRLEERASACVLRSVDASGIEQSQGLGIPFPCAFHLDRDGALRTIRSGAFAYAIVESARPVGTGRDCDTRLRAIRTNGKALQVSEHQDRVASCPPFQWDYYMFTGLFK